MSSKLKRILSMALVWMMVFSLIPAVTAGAAEGTGINLVPTEANDFTANYVCTWNIQDWVAWHEARDSENPSNGNKRDIVDPDHIFGNEEKGIVGWADVMFPELRGDLLFLLDDGWDLPYGTEKNGKNKEYFGCGVLPTDKFPADEWGDTPAERLKTMNERLTALGWAGIGMVIHCQESTAYDEYYFGGDSEAYWKERLEWSKYAGVAYWKIDWGTHQKDITWRRQFSEWAEEVYPELIVEHCVGGRGRNTENNRIQQTLLFDNVEFGNFSDAFRTYDVLDPLMTVITLDRVGEHLQIAQTEAGANGDDPMGLLNAEDEMYISASLGLTFGVMRHPPQLAADTTGTGEDYYAKGTEPNHYFAGGKKFVDTRATRDSLDEVARATLWERIAPAYTMGDYETEISATYLTDDWQFSSSEPGWDGSTNHEYQAAPAVIARGIDLPTVTTSDGAAVPFLTASRNPNGAISIATHARTTASEGYQPVMTADVKLNAGDLTGKIGVFGYYGSLTMTFNQNLSGKRVLAQDLLADEATDITDQVKINGSTITIGGDLLAQIGLSAATEGDSSLPGLVIQIGEESDFADPAPAKARADSWDMMNASFEKQNYDTSKGQTLKSNTGAAWRRWNNTGNSYLTTDAHTGSYAGIHTGTGNFEVSTYQLNQSVPNGVYKITAWVKSSGFSRTAPGGDHDASAQMLAMNTGEAAKSVNIQAMGKLDNWTKVELDDVKVTNRSLQVEFYTYGAAGEYLIFDDVQVEFMEAVDDSRITADVILEFDFSEVSGSAVTGVANGEKVTATAQNVSFITDDDGNDVVVFPEGGDNAATGITYSPGDNDPMKNLTDGGGATINLWIKTAQDTFNSPLFSYGALKADGTGLGASAQIMGRNNGSGEVMFYRNQAGSTGGHKIPAIGSPYTVGTWQMVTYVENGDGSGTIYVDGTARGSIAASDKTLLGFATDANSPDNYYLGFVPYENTDTHFAGQMDTFTVYNGALTAAQVERLYNERFAEQTQIVLEADGDGVLGGQAVRNDGYVGWMGKGADATGEEGTVSFSFHAKTADDWQMEVYYLSNQTREFDITVNEDADNVITLSCPAGTSWNDLSTAQVANAGMVTLKKGTNTLTVGNADGNAPSLVKVVLTRSDAVDAAKAAEVEEMILSQLGTVDSYAMLSQVEDCRAAYDALTEEQKAYVSEDAYNLLLGAEAVMSSFKTSEVNQLINAIGEVTSVEQEADITLARSKYDALTDEEKAMISGDMLQKLVDAEMALAKLKGDYGDVNQDGSLDVEDMAAVKQLILNQAWTEDELRRGDLNGDGKLNILDIILIKNTILGR